jgi:hypothetical protein
VLFAVGCGETAAEREESRWERHTGEHWEAFVAGHQVGWSFGCQKSLDLYLVQLRREGRRLSDDDLVALLPHCLDPPRPGDAPESIPANPRDAGHEYGVSAGCGLTDRSAIEDACLEAFGH